MMDIGGDLAVEAAKELVKAIVTEMVGLVKKIPALWRNSGKAQQEQVAGQLARSTSELVGSSRQGPESEHALMRHEGAWEALIRSLLAENPETRHELRELVALINRQSQGAGQSVSQRNAVYAVQ
ncbi:MAG: hypothetical protein ACRDS9_22915 [Pseudonocardiaceae bacterium]